MAQPLLANILGPDGLILVGIVVLVLLGGSRVPKLARSMGSFHRDLRAGMEEGKKDMETLRETLKVPELPPIGIEPIQSADAEANSSE